LIEHVRWSVVVCFSIAACASSAERDRSPSVAAAPPTAGIVATTLATPTAITGAHGAAIEILAITREGDAVVSADRRGALRVWPGLDGQREPFVVHAGRPAALAIAHAREGFLIANIDVARGLELIHVDDDGRLRGRAKVRGEAIVDAVLIDDSALVLRADQTIELLAPDGERRHTLTPDAGTRIVRLLVAGDRVLAIGEAGTKKFVRWIEPGARAWGTMLSTVGFFANDPMAVSPDGAYLVTNRLGIARSIALATGKQGPAICSDNKSKRTVALGFIDADTVACLVEGKLVWWSMGGKTGIGVETTSFVHESMREGIGRDVIVTSEDRSLVLHRVDGARMLGYGIAWNPVMRFSSDVIAIESAQRSIVVDSTLRAKMTVDHPLEEGIHPLGDGYAVGLSSRRDSVTDTWADSHAVSVFDIAKAMTHQPLTVRTSGAIAFERATGLLATVDGASVHLLRYDPKTHMFGEPIVVQNANAIHRIVLLDPALSKGIAAMTIEERAVGAIIGEIYAGDLGATKVKARHTTRIDGELLAIDRAGRIYSHDVYGRVHVRSRVHGNREVMIDALALVPDADGSRLVSVVGSEVTLYLANGQRVWTSSVRDVEQVRWLGNDLVAIFASSLARFDLVTGELVARQCGWDFGLRPVKSSSSLDTQNVCDAD
jgi:hypothetical protein